MTVAVPAGALDAASRALTDAGIPEERITAIPAPAGRPPSAALAAAAAAATAEHLLLMQSPAMGLTRDWLTRLLGYSAQPGIAVAGPVVLGPDGRIQQAGIAIPEGIPLHLLHGTRSSMDDLFGYGTSVYNVSAVSGVLATPRDTYQQLGGLDPELRRPRPHRLLPARRPTTTNASSSSPTPACAPPAPTPPSTTYPPSGSSATPGPAPTPTTPTTTPTTAPTAATSARRGHV